MPIYRFWVASLDRPETDRVERVLAFDFGLKHIGVARGVSLTGAAAPVTTLTAKAGKVGWQRIADLIAAEQPTVLLVGLPLNMDGSPGAMTDPAQQFAQWLALRSNLPVHMVDERLTSVAANERIFERRPDRKAGGQSRDNHAIAACVIAESYFRDGASTL